MPVEVAQNGLCLVPGYAGSPLMVLEITVNDYAALWDMIRNQYNGRLVDILDVTLA